MHLSVNNLREAPRGGSRLPLVLAIVLAGVGFLLTQHDLLKSTLEEYGTTADVLEVGAAGGRLKNEIGFSLVALLGVCLLAYRSKNRFSAFNLGAIFLLAFLAWCAASKTWSIDPVLTAKRVAILAICFVGALGVARHLSARDLCLLMLVLTGAYVTIGVCAELALGTFKPWATDYRFAGTMHPNGQAENCACLCLAGFLLLGSTQRYRYWLLGLLAAGVAALLLTKSRTACAALAVGLLALFLLRTSWRWKMSAGMAVVCAICAIFLVSHFLGVDAEIATVLTLGRTEHVGTLSGRTELWPELLWYAQARPLAGYGYGAFWTPDNVAEISATVFWGVSTAHSGYLEMLLNVGVVGVALLAIVVTTAMLRAVKLARGSGDVGNQFVFALFVVCAIYGVAEAGFAEPSFITWVAGCALTQLTFFGLSERSQLAKRRVAREQTADTMALLGDAT